MITHFEAIVAMLAAIIAVLGALVTLVWKARGFADRLNATDMRLAAAIEALATSQRDQHRENQDRFRAIEARLPGPPRGRSGHWNAAPGGPGR